MIVSPADCKNKHHSPFPDAVATQSREVDRRPRARSQVLRIAQDFQVTIVADRTAAYAGSDSQRVGG
jgi:hypothetical protein